MTLLALIIIATFIGAHVGRRLEQAKQQCAGLGVRNERAVAVNDAAASAETACDWGGVL